MLSQTGISFSEDEIKSLTQRIQFGGDEVVKAKDGAGSATLSMAYAGARFTGSLLEALDSGTSGTVIEPAYVKSDVYASEGIEYFATNVELGPEGCTKIHPVGIVSEFEKGLLAKCIEDLKKSIDKGMRFAQEKTANL